MTVHSKFRQGIHKLPNKFHQGFPAKSVEHIQELSSLIIPTRDFHLLSSLNILSSHQALHALLIHFERIEKYEEGKDSLK